jgi:putative oxidoreductase
MNITCPALTALFGRIFISAIFLFSGVGKIADWSGAAAGMEKQGMVAVPVFLAGAIALEIFGGLSVLLGFFTRFGASALIVFLLPATVIFHDFWVVEEGMARMNQMQHFMKNAAIVGGLLVIAALGPGVLSLDHWLVRRVRAAKSAIHRHDEAVPVG